MEFSIKTLAPDRAKAGCLVLGVYAGGSLSRAARKRHLKQLKVTGASAVITGKASLEGCFTVEEALEALT